MLWCLVTNRLVKAMFLPVVMYGCESWTIKKAECQRIDAFELWCWRRLLRVPWTARRSNQSILKQISPEYSLEGLMLKLKLQSFGHLMWRANSYEKTLMPGKIEGRRRRDDRGWDGWIASRLNGHGFGWTLGVGNGQGDLACCGSWGRKELNTTERLNRTELNWKDCIKNGVVKMNSTEATAVFFIFRYLMHFWWFCSKMIVNALTKSWRK